MDTPDTRPCIGVSARLPGAEVVYTPAGAALPGPFATVGRLVIALRARFPHLPIVVMLRHHLKALGTAWANGQVCLDPRPRGLALRSVLRA